jgi:hypothetical protein
MFPANHKPLPVAVAYTGRHGKRCTRRFANAYAARQFYVAKDKHGAHPQVLRSDAMSTGLTDVAATTPAPAPAAKAPKPKQTKAAAPKAAKQAKPKAAKPKAKADKANKAEQPKDPNALTGMAVAVLKALAKGKELTKAQLSKVTGGRVTSKLLGAANRDGFGVQGGGLLERGLIKAAKHEDSRATVYTITAAGNKALAKANG